jgi:hypothetical protein
MGHPTGIGQAIGWHCRNCATFRKMGAWQRQISDGPAEPTTRKLHDASNTAWSASLLVFRAG